jgi:uncharacterized protein (DUF433 family)
MSDQALVKLERPLYTYAESDRIAGVSRGTSKRWLSGYRYVLGSGATRRQPAVTTGTYAPPRETGVSFAELIEVAAIARLRDTGLRVQEIRSIVDACRDIFGLEHPLIDLRFKTDGREAFVELSDGSLIQVSRRRRQRAWDRVLRPFLTTVEYEGKLARRWWPDGPDAGIVVDPDFGLGTPVIASTGIRTEIVFELFLAGAPQSEIADDFNVREQEVEAAIRFEAKRERRPSVQVASAS